MVSFAHIFSGHDHHLCEHYSKRHFHKKQVDCQFMKFHKNPAVQLDKFYVEQARTRENKTIYLTHYCFLSEYQALPFALRGPPAIV